MTTDRLLHAWRPRGADGKGEGQRGWGQERAL